jgi:cyclophilin family peptidyl-prolyl cis-trans isomerase
MNLGPGLIAPEPVDPGKYTPRPEGVVYDVYEGDREITRDDQTERPSGMSGDADKAYFWKMSKDKRTIDVIVPVDESVTKDRVIYRMGEDSPDPNRGPLLQVGFKYRDEKGDQKENIIIDGQLLNSVNIRDCFWVLEDISGVQCVVVTIRRPSMIRKRSDSIAQVERMEERIEPQTWDSLLLEEERKPEITDRVFLDIACEGRLTGRIEMGLYGKAVPRTVQNFLGLVKGEYVDNDGNTQKASHCLKKSAFNAVVKGHFLTAGNPGFDHSLREVDAQTLSEYCDMIKAFKEGNSQLKEVGDIQSHWGLRWGADLGLHNGEEPVKEASAINSKEDLHMIKVVQNLEKLVEKGEGAKLWFYRPEFSKGVDVSGGTFELEREGKKIPHRGTGILSMDRDETNDVQGSQFFITLREFPHMDGRYAVFGEVTEGLDIVEYIESEFDGWAKDVVIEDCGVITA